MKIKRFDPFYNRSTALVKQKSLRQVFVFTNQPYHSSIHSQTIYCLLHTKGFKSLLMAAKNR